MAGFERDVMLASNMNFDPAAPKPHVAIIDAAGKLPIGTGQLQPTPEILGGFLTSPDTSITIGYSSPNITLTASGTTPLSFPTDDGTATPAANLLTIAGLSGSKTSGLGATVTVRSPPYSDQGGSTTVTLNSGSFATAAITLTTPASAGLADGDLLEFVATNGVLVIQLTGTQIAHIGNTLTTAAGTLTSTATGDSVSLRYQVSTNDFWATSVIGNWILA